MENKRAVGSRYEAEAAVFLEKLGYKILEQNYRDRLGEIDIVAREGAYLVFVEVKYRTGGAQGTPEEAVNRHKQRVISRTALYFLSRYCLAETTPVRFDVAAVSGGNVTLYKNAFEFCG